jgi:hypothetical protein
MVLAYTRDNLGTDFSIFFYFAIFAACVGLLAGCVNLYLYCNLEPILNRDRLLIPDPVKERPDSRSRSRSKNRNREISKGLTEDLELR